jgi:hypothetical protein
MLMNLLAAAVKRDIEWRGTRYDLRSRDEVGVMARDNR